VSKTEYRKIIGNLKMFFEGKKKALVKKLEREMKDLAKKQEFEKATKLKRTIFALKHIQDISLIKNSASIRRSHLRMEAYDVAHISGSAMVGVMVVLEDGEPDKNEYRKFNIKTVAGADDTASLAEILSRRFGHSEWQYPKLIVIDGGKAQKNRAERVLKEMGIVIPVVSVVKDERHRPREIMGKVKDIKANEKDILLANSEAHRFAIGFHRKKMRGRGK